MARRNHWPSGKICIATIALISGVGVTIAFMVSGAAVGSRQDHILLARATRAESELATLRAQMAELRQLRQGSARLLSDGSTPDGAASLREEVARQAAENAAQAAEIRRLRNVSVAAPVVCDGAVASGWDDTEQNRKILGLLQKVANPKREVMLALANDVMMCTNRKTCWWNGGNVLETFLKASKRLALKNVVVITLDDATHTFCEKHGGASCLRLELPVPKAQHNSRGANMISTLKWPSRHTTPHHTTPHHTTTHHTTPHHTTPRHATPHRTTPHHTMPHHTTPHHATPRHTAPHHTTPCHTMPHHATPCHTMPAHQGAIPCLHPFASHHTSSHAQGMGFSSRSCSWDSPLSLLTSIWSSSRCSPPHHSSTTHTIHHP
jgi:hypothetical protein